MVKVVGREAIIMFLSKAHYISNRKEKHIQGACVKNQVG